jgi:tetratricopeptide (TPR) repeat protein
MRQEGFERRGASAALALLDDIHRHRLRRATVHPPRGDLIGARMQEEVIIAFNNDRIRKDPSNADHHFLKANALFHLGRLSPALIEYRLALQIDPNYRAAKDSIDLIINKLNTSGGSKYLQ